MAPIDLREYNEKIENIANQINERYKVIKKDISDIEFKTGRLFQTFEDNKVEIKYKEKLQEISNEVKPDKLFYKKCNCLIIIV